MMIERVTLLISVLAVSLPAQAGWDIGGGLEDYQWKEYPAGYAGTSRESGMRSALFVNWTQDGDSGTRFAWRAKLYDSWRFAQSSDVIANRPTDPPGSYWVIHQPKSSMDTLGAKLLVSF